MKRRSNGGLNPAVKFGQLVERRNSPFIREDEGKGATFGGVGGLALCAGFGLGHSGGQQLAEFSRHGHGAAVEVIGKRISFGGGNATELAGRAAKRLVRNVAPVGGIGAEARGDCIRVGGMARQLEGEGGGFGGGESVHGLLRSVTVGESSHITSDASTTVRREAARLMWWRK